MKKVRIILISIITILIGITNVYAADSSVNIGGAEDEKVAVGQTKTIEVKVSTTKEKIGIVTGKIKTEGNITIESVEGKNNWGLTYNDEAGENKGLFNIVKASGATEEVIMEIKYKAGNEAGTGKIIIEEVETASISYVKEKLGNISKTITVEANKPVEEKKLESIEITEEPDKVEYKEGEKFSAEGMELTAVYSDGSRKVVTEYEISPNRDLTKEDTEITISYTENGKTVKATQEITVKEDTTGGAEEEEKKLEQIKITKNPKKVDYKEGEKFSTEGMEVTAVYSDGSTKIVTGYKYSPNGALKTTDTKITISYTEGGITKEAKAITIKVTKAEGGSGTGTGTGSGTGAGTGYPAAGLETVIIPAIVVAVLAIVGYVGSKKYKNI